MIGTAVRVRNGRFPAGGPSNRPDQETSFLRLPAAGVSNSRQTRAWILREKMHGMPPASHDRQNLLLGNCPSHDACRVLSKYTTRWERLSLAMTMWLHRGNSRQATPSTGDSEDASRGTPHERSDLVPKSAKPEHQQVGVMSVIFLQCFRDVCPVQVEYLHGWSRQSSAVFSQRLNAFPGSAISETEEYQKSSQSSSGNPVNSMRFSG